MQRLFRYGTARRIASVIPLLLALAAGAAHAARDLPDSGLAGQKGPINVRNQFPLKLLFLGFSADDQLLAPRGKFLLDAHVSFSNTFARTDDVIEIRNDGGRRSLSPAEFDQIIAANAGDDEFMIDMESYFYNFRFMYGLSERMQLDLEVPVISVGGGILDGVVEGFHDSFNLGQAGRTLYPRHDSTLALFVDGQKLFLSGVDHVGLGDVVMSLKFPVYANSGRVPFVDGRIAVKLPTGDEDRFLGSGNTDVGLNLYASRTSRRVTVHANLGAVFPGRWELMPNLDIRPFYSALVALEYVPRQAPGISYIIQDLIQTSPLHHVSHSELGEIAHEVTAGVKFDLRPSLRATIAITENHMTFNNGTDIGLHFGLLSHL